MSQKEATDSYRAGLLLLRKTEEYDSIGPPQGDIANALRQGHENAL